MLLLDIHLSTYKQNQMQSSLWNLQHLTLTVIPWWIEKKWKKNRKNFVRPQTEKTKTIWNYLRTYEDYVFTDITLLNDVAQITNIYVSGYPHTLRTAIYYLWMFHYLINVLVHIQCEYIREHDMIREYSKDLIMITIIFSVSSWLSSCQVIQLFQL